VIVLDALRIAVLVFVTAVLQVSAAPQLTPTDSTPDLMLILVVALAVHRGGETAAAAGFAGGLLIDSVTGGWMGLSSLLYVVAGWAVGRRARNDEDVMMGTAGNAAVPLRSEYGYAVLAAVAVQVGYAVLQGLLGQGLPLGFTVDHIIVPGVILTIALALPLLPLLQRLLHSRTRIDTARTAPI
jgi:rod shape-determining protein MreD